VARLLDGLVAAGPYLVLDLLLPGALGKASGALAAAAYILFSDGLTGVRFMHRRSLGKHLMGLRPTRLDDDAVMTPTASARRNGPLVVGYFGGLPVVGGLFSLVGSALVLYEIYRIYTDPQGRRWGDTLAGTRVVAAASPFDAAAPSGSKRR
jgi:uncharacterized RDD family membrane protein YckC